MKSIISLLFFVVSSLFIINKNNAQYTEMGIGLGFSTYWGDLNSNGFGSNFTNNSGLAIQLSGRKIFSQRYGLRGSFSYGSVRAADSNSSEEWQQQRNLSFKSSITELAIMGEFYIFGFNTDAGSSVFLPYITAGIAGFRFDPKAIYQGNEVRLQPLGTEGQGLTNFDNKYGLYAVSIPFGAGAKFIINSNINISADIILRRTFTDYIDDVSTNYVDFSEMGSQVSSLTPRLANRMNEFLGQQELVTLPTGSQRGGAKVDDYYFMSVISLNIMISDGKGGFGRGKKVMCPKF
jgi:opacity protein-like surface antigen